MSEHASPRATILVPTHGRPARLHGLLASLHRTHHIGATDVETIIIDNNHTASTLSHAVANLAAEYGLRCLRGPGPKASALNIAARTSRAEYLVFLDDDTTVPDQSWLNELLAPFDTNVGYVAGNVLAKQTSTPAQQAWEVKGGLSKGERPRELPPPRRRWTNHAWRLKTVAAGANSAIRRDVFESIGGFDESLGPGTRIGHSETLEVVDRILRAGYIARYTPRSTVLHDHPATMYALRTKLRQYARGDAVLGLHLATGNGDVPGAAWTLIGHPTYRLRNLLLSLLRRYRLPPACALASLLGSLEGVGLAIGSFTTRGRHP